MKQRSGERDFLPQKTDANASEIEMSTGGTRNRTTVAGAAHERETVASDESAD